MVQKRTSKALKKIFKSFKKDLQNREKRISRASKSSKRKYPYTLKNNQIRQKKHLHTFVKKKYHEQVGFETGDENIYIVTAINVFKNDHRINI